jgi:enamine deaminase RidA (YjgF/YER057c/UK114 family)
MNYKVKIQTEVTIWHGDPNSQDARNEAWFRLFDDYNASNYPEETIFTFEEVEDEQ